MPDRDWMTKAACRNHPNPEVFFPSARDVHVRKEIAEAARICAACPVIEKCGQYRRDTESAWGIWGGDIVRTQAYGNTLAQDRTSLVHGTEGMYKRHLRRREKPCPACTQAQQRARSQRRDRRRETA